MFAEKVDKIVQEYKDPKPILEELFKEYKQRSVLNLHDIQKIKSLFNKIKNDSCYNIFTDSNYKSLVEELFIKNPNHPKLEYGLSEIVGMVDDKKLSIPKGLNISINYIKKNYSRISKDSLDYLIDYFEEKIQSYASDYKKTIQNNGNSAINHKTINNLLYSMDTGLENLISIKNNKYATSNLPVDESFAKDEDVIELRHELSDKDISDYNGGIIPLIDDIDEKASPGLVLGKAKEFIYNFPKDSTISIDGIFDFYNHSRGEGRRQGLNELSQYVLGLINKNKQVENETSDLSKVYLGLKFLEKVHSKSPNSPLVSNGDNIGKSKFYAKVNDLFVTLSHKREKRIEAKNKREGIVDYSDLPEVNIIPFRDKILDQSKVKETRELINDESKKYESYKDALIELYTNNNVYEVTKRTCVDGIKDSIDNKIARLQNRKRTSEDSRRLFDLYKIKSTIKILEDSNGKTSSNLELDSENFAKYRFNTNALNESKYIIGKINDVYSSILNGESKFKMLFSGAKKKGLKDAIGNIFHSYDAQGAEKKLLQYSNTNSLVKKNYDILQKEIKNFYKPTQTKETNPNFLAEFNKGSLDQLYEEKAVRGLADKPIRYHLRPEQKFLGDRAAFQ